MTPNARLDNSGDTRNEYLLHARSLVEQALDLVDKNQGPAEIGARLQEVIDALNRVIEIRD